MTAVLPRTEKGRATRRRIVGAAAGLVRTQGVAATTLDDVCLTARVSRGQLYHYFEGRDDLLRAVVAETADLVLGAQTGYLDDLGSWAGIDRWLTHLVAVQASNPRPAGCPLGSLVPQLADRDDAARGALATAFGLWEKHLHDGLVHLHATGGLAADADPAALATAAMAALQGGLLLAHVRGDADQLRRAVDGIRLMFGAVRAR